MAVAGISYHRAVAYVRRRSLEDGSKRYECCWRDPVTNRERSKTFRRRVDADQFVKLVDADVLRGINVPTPVDGRRTVEDVVERWFLLHAPTLKPKTAHSYRNLIDSRIVPALGAVQLGKLRFSDAQGWVSAMIGEGLSASRIRQAHVVLAAALDMAARDGMIAANPARGIVLPRVNKRERPWLEPDVIEAVADRCDEPYGLAVRLMGYEGLRWGELVGLKRRHVDLQAGRLVIQDNVVEVGGALVPGTTKSSEPRVVPILAHLTEPLREHLVSLPEGGGAPLFLGPRGATLRYSWWRRRVWMPACEAVGVDVPIHALRHSAGKALSNSGATPMMIKSFMGHASAAFSMDVYGHTSDQDLAATASRLEVYRTRSLMDGSGSPTGGIGVRTSWSHGLDR